MLGPYLLQRRIDTDFVNLTPIVEWCGKGRGYPVLSMVPNAVVIGRGWGSEKIWGVWVPLEVAQSYVNDLGTSSTDAEKNASMEGLNVFLGDELVERFPSALKDFHRTNSSGRMLKQFGRWFESMVTFAHAQATAAANSATAMMMTTTTTCSPLNPQKMMQADSRQSWMQKETVVPMAGAFALGAVMTMGERDKQLGQQHSRQESFSQLHRRRGSGKQEDCLDLVSPLSAKEEEMFQELCVFPGEEEEKMKLEGSRMEVEFVIGEGEEGEEDIPKVIISGNGGVVSVSVSVDTVATAEPEALDESEPPVVDEDLPTPLDEEADACASEPEAPAMKTRPTRSATMSKVHEKQERQSSLRRSKRVADALAVQTQQQKQKTRGRKKPGSRNTLS